MVRNVNVNVNVDFCFTLSCELVGRLPNLKRWKFSTAHIPGCWRGGRWSEKCQLGRCTNQSWFSQARTHKKRCSCAVIFWHHWLFPWHNCFLRLENSRCEVIRWKDRELLTNQNVLYTRLTYVKPYQNVLEKFWTNLKLWRIWLTDQSYLRIMLKRRSISTIYSMTWRLEIIKSTGVVPTLVMY